MRASWDNNSDWESSLRIFSFQCVPSQLCFFHLSFSPSCTGHDFTRLLLVHMRFKCWCRCWVEAYLNAESSVMTDRDHTIRLKADSRDSLWSAHFTFSSFNTGLVLGLGLLLNSSLLQSCVTCTHNSADELSKWTDTIQSLWYSPVVCRGCHKTLTLSCENFQYLSSSPWCRDVQAYPGPDDIVERGVQRCLLFCHFWKHEGIFQLYSCEIFFCCVCQRLVQVSFSVCLIFPPSPPPFSAPVVMQHDGLMANVLLL